jgi:hypothetical protein
VDAPNFFFSSNHRIELSCFGAGIEVNGVFAQRLVAVFSRGRLSFLSLSELIHGLTEGVLFKSLILHGLSTGIFSGAQPQEQVFQG